MITKIIGCFKCGTLVEGKSTGSKLVYPSAPINSCGKEEIEYICPNCGQTFYDFWTYSLEEVNKLGGFIWI